MADTQTATDDPDLQAGRKILSGDNSGAAPVTGTDGIPTITVTPSGAPPSAVADPDLQSGRDVLTATAASPASPTTGTQPPNFTQSHSVENSWLGIPAIHNFAAGATQGARSVLATGAGLAKWVDDRVPILAALDKSVGIDPGAVKNQLDQTRADYEASPEGQSYTGKAGEVVGGLVATAPLLGPVGSAVGAGLRLGGAAAETAIPLLARVPNFLERAVIRSLQGGVEGGTYGAATSGGSDQPVGQNILQNAEIGAVAGPIGGAVGDALGYAGRAGVRTFNYLTGRSVPQDIEATMAAARARAGTPAPAPSTGGAAAQPAPTTAPAPSTAPTPTTGTPRAAGAQATTPAQLAANALTRRQAIAGKVDYLDQTLADRPNIGRADWTEYVKGNTPTQAEGLGDAHLASVQRQVEPGSQAFTNKRNAAVANRADHFDERAGTNTMLENAEKELADWDKKTLGPIWARKTPVDASGVKSYVEGRLNSPSAQIGPVEQALNEINDRLVKRGTDELHTDPEQLYGARRHISYMLSRAGRQANPAYGSDDVMRELIGARDALDRAIEPGAPGFKGWLTGHAERAQDIDRMDVLQTMRQKLLGANGDIQLTRLTSELKGLRIKMAQDGANPVHSLNLEDLEMLRNLRRDLLREGNRALAVPVGSGTSHNLDVGAQMGLNAATTGAHIVASHIPGGNALVDATLTKRAMTNAANAKQMWERKLLEPPPTQPPPAGGY